MNKNKLIMSSLPLVASVLGKKYGVNVEIGGDTAFTDGKTIQLPSMPLDCDENFVGLARGYIDHEAAHIRETNFTAVNSAGLTPVEKNIWNTFEDWRVETKLARIFPGCRQNFNWLIRHLFEGESVLDNCDPATEILNWLLFTVRSWQVPAIRKTRDQTGEFINKHYPGLLDQINSVLKKVRVNCDSTEDCILYAKEISTILKSKSDDMEKRAGFHQSGKAFSLPESEENHAPDHLPSNFENDECSNPKAFNQLKNLLSADTDDLPKSLGEILVEDLVDKAPDCPDKGLQVAMIGNKQFLEFSSEELQEIKRSSSALKTKLQSTMQSKILRRTRYARHGRLGTTQLYKIAVANPRVFVKHGETQRINTAVHILIDCSGSMHGRIELTTKACYGVAKALESVQGINVAATAFPAATPVRNHLTSNDAAVYPIVRHGDFVHSSFSTNPSGSTPMGEATWWVLQQMSALTESRKIILILTDGCPDSRSNMNEAIAHARRLQIEIYGIGIDSTLITTLLPDHSCTIQNLSELAPAMFKMLQNGLIK